MAPFGIFISVRNRIILIKSPEMIHSYHIIKSKAVLHSGNPPGIACFLMLFPVIERISPKLSIFCKGIGRATCHRLGSSPFQLEQGGVVQHIRGIQRNIDGNISNQLNPKAIHIGL